MDRNSKILLGVGVQMMVKLSAYLLGFACLTSCAAQPTEDRSEDAGIRLCGSIIDAVEKQTGWRGLDVGFSRQLGPGGIPDAAVARAVERRWGSDVDTSDLYQCAYISFDSGTNPTPGLRCPEGEVAPPAEPNVVVNRVGGFVIVERACFDPTGPSNRASIRRGEQE